MSHYKENTIPLLEHNKVTGKSLIVSNNTEFEDDSTEVNEANISFQMTAPKISFPSPQFLQVKRSYLDRSLHEKDCNVGKEYELPIEQTDSHSRNRLVNPCKLKKAKDIESPRCVDDSTTVMTDGYELIPIRSIIHNINRSRQYSKIDSMEELKAENTELRRKNEVMQSALQRIESKYQRISQLLDQVPIHKHTNLLEESEKIEEQIESVESQGDETEIESKDIFSRGIMQILQQNTGSHLQQIIQQQKTTIKEYKDFIIKIMHNIEDILENGGDTSVRSFFQ
jgi:hypothetical protein